MLYTLEFCGGYTLIFRVKFGTHASSVVKMDTNLLRGMWYALHNRAWWWMHIDHLCKILYTLYTFEFGGPECRPLLCRVNILDMLHTIQFAGQRGHLMPASQIRVYSELMQTDLLRENRHTLHIGVWWWMQRALIHLAREIWYALHFSFVVNAHWFFTRNLV